MIDYGELSSYKCFAGWLVKKNGTIAMLYKRCKRDDLVRISFVTFDVKFPLTLPVRSGNLPFRGG